MKNFLEHYEECINGFEARVNELLDEMNERKSPYVENWMEGSRLMVKKLEESATLEEYDNWRISCGCIPLFQSIIRNGKESLLEKLKFQQLVDYEAHKRFMRGNV
jgi:hypothetical protein